MQELQDLEHHMTELITSYETAIAAEDVSSLSETAFMDIHPIFLDKKYMAVGPPSPSEEKPPSPLVSSYNCFHFINS